MTLPGCQSSVRRAISSYATIGLETEVLGASPERLITLLFSAARAAIAQACLHMENNRIAERGMAISKAIQIVEEGLRAALDRQAGGELAANLDQLYEYIARSLLTANIDADVNRLRHVDMLLANIAQAWQTSVDRSVTNP